MELVKIVLTRKKESKNMKITVYSTRSCIYCVKLKSWLDEKGVKYTNYNVDENPIAAQNMVRLSGQMGVPFSTVELDDGGQVNILGFDRMKFENVLKNQ